MKKQSSYKVQIKVGDAEVNVEGAETGVVKIVEALSDMLRGGRKVVASQISSPSVVPVAASTQRTSPTDIRSFFEEKQPSSDIEAAAAAAYYNQYLAPEPHRKETIDSESLSESFRLAKRPLPAKTIWTLTNARNAGYLDSVGEGGQFRLNAVGYNLVEHGMGKGAENRKRNKPRRKPGRRK